MTEAKLKELKEKLEAKPDLVNKLIEQETPEAAQALLKSEGLSFTREEVVELGEIITKIGENNGELSDSDLEGVAGGCVGAVLAGAAAVTTIIANAPAVYRTLRRIRWRSRW